jgi:hypothetical protein
MCFGNRPLVITLWLITVSAAMCPSSARSKLTPPFMRPRTFAIPKRSTYSGRNWSITTIITREGRSGAAGGAAAAVAAGSSPTTSAINSVLPA